VRKRPAYRGGRTIRLAGKSRDRGPHVPGGTLLSEIISSSFRQILFFPVWDRLSKKNKAIIQPEFPRVKNALKSIPRLLECGASAPRIVRKLRALPLPAFARGAPWASEDRGQGTKTKAPRPPSSPRTRRSAGPAPFGVRRLGAADSAQAARIAPAGVRAGQQPGQALPAAPHRGGGASPAMRLTRPISIKSSCPREGWPGHEFHEFTNAHSQAPTILITNAHCRGEAFRKRILSRRRDRPTCKRCLTHGLLGMPRPRWRGSNPVRGAGSISDFWIT
jgi:hypothetical protein